jgi:hypothetical protein
VCSFAAVSQCTSIVHNSSQRADETILPGEIVSVVWLFFVTILSEEQIEYRPSCRIFVALEEHD